MRHRIRIAIHKHGFVLSRASGMFQEPDVFTKEALVKLISKASWAQILMPLLLDMQLVGMLRLRLLAFLMSMVWADPNHTAAPKAWGNCQAFGCYSGYNPGHNCQCNDECKRYGNCCADFNTCSNSGGSCQSFGCPANYEA